MAADPDNQETVSSESIATLAQLLESPSGSDAYDFERGCTQIAVTDPAAVEAAKASWTGEPDPDRAFTLFSIAFNHYRRELDSKGMSATLARGRPRFGTLPLFKHYESMARIDGSVGDLLTGLELENDAIARMPDNAGALHTRALLISQLRAAGEGDDALTKSAVRDVDRAIALHPGRGRFYATRARLRYELGDYEKAREDLASAIRLEDTSTTDARSRIQQYQVERSIADALSLMDRRMEQRVHEKVGELDKKADSLQKKLEDSELRIVEVIGFVTAIIALVLSSAQIVSNMTNLSDALVVLTALAVILLASISVGAFILRRTT